MTMKNQKKLQAFRMNGVSLWLWSEATSKIQSLLSRGCPLTAECLV
jgi:hypothetical protein